MSCFRLEKPHLASFGFVLVHLIKFGVVDFRAEGRDVSQPVPEAATGPAGEHVVPHDGEDPRGVERLAFGCPGVVIERNIVPSCFEQ